MLRIRLTRTGKKAQPSYRIVVAEHTSPVKAKFVEILGYYNVSRNPRELTYKEDRLAYWMSQGAQPTATLASLLKGRGMKDMEVYFKKGQHKRKKKKGGEGASGEGGSAQVTEAAAPATTPEATPEATPAPERSRVKTSVE